MCVCVCVSGTPPTVVIERTAGPFKLEAELSRAGPDRSPQYPRLLFLFFPLLLCFDVGKMFGSPSLPSLVLCKPTAKRASEEAPAPIYLCR